MEVHWTIQMSVIYDLSPSHSKLEIQKNMRWKFVILIWLMKLTIKNNNFIVRILKPENLHNVYRIWLGTAFRICVIYFSGEYRSTILIYRNCALIDPCIFFARKPFELFMNCQCSTTVPFYMMNVYFVLFIPNITRTLLVMQWHRMLQKYFWTSVTMTMLVLVE